MNLVSTFGMIRSLEMLEQYKTEEDRIEAIKKLQNDAIISFRKMFVLFIGVFGFAILIGSFM
jgi:hypothetical protein